MRNRNRNRGQVHGEESHHIRPDGLAVENPVLSRVTRAQETFEPVHQTRILRQNHLRVFRSVVAHG